MNVILLIDKSPIWQNPVLDTNLAQYLINTIVKTKCVRRLAISVHESWAPGVTGAKPLFKQPDLTKLKSSIFWNSKELDEEVYDIFRSMDFEEALIISSVNPYIWPFLIEELYKKESLTNKDGLVSTRWDQVLEGVSQKWPEGSHPTDPLTMQYIYQEMANGAAWEDLLEELNGEQNSILQ